ncbi:MAG: dicarboxylate/amino acid:cation symporter [Rhodospirillaceae bacterium]|jgi:Na+/H+-dicarboxylate symporter|nr:dicarboxylate/amino acid:cation symporter [Rhodospirillaceae bacterium]MBT5242148.1 dicarboxylate/amino acid:cation symporter [Rhodospirillaceae bacterium]MBT5565875.1 dicarboxylate/amino acid:cation symporter [Rhodospirillaceae bacterium]MBT6088704.1 dicarboxylate/amino acid:cation symporter [Rhodospirillaceae bacterium]MBT6959727.1 dicarboxylate/amino acid:cation symporter [Rhodospirillaceae bacterium]
MATIQIVYWLAILGVFSVLYWLGAKKGVTLWVRVLTALAVGIIAGFLFGDAVESTKWIGDLFVRLIRMLVVPIIFTTLVAGLLSMGDPKKLGSIGGKAVILYMLTTAVAICIGLFLGVVFQPGVGIELAAVSSQSVQPAADVVDRFLGIIPTNPVAALAEGDVLAIIVFSLLFGTGIVLAGDKGRPVGDAIASAAEAMLKVAHIVMELAPYGVFALVAWVAGTMGTETILKLLTLVVIVYVACVIHAGLVYGGLIKFIFKLPAVRFFRGIIDAQAVAYSTASSSATLPVTLTCVEENLGVKSSVASSVLPLGATINMDGTALYLGVVAVFSAQVFGIDLVMTDYVMIAVTVTLASIGTAGVPSASLFLLSTILPVIGITVEQTALIVGLILPIDRILDMARTTVNVTGDAAVAVAVAKLEGELDEETFRKVATV